MRRYKTPKQLHGEQYLRDRNLLVSPRVIRLTEEIKCKSRCTQEKEDAKRALKLRHKSSINRYWAVTDQSTQTDGYSFRSDDEKSISSYSIVERTVTFCITLLASFIIAIAICVLIGYYFRVYFLYSRLQYYP
jgi:hypothetical protein